MYGFEGTGYVWFRRYRVRMASSVQDAWLRVYGVPGFESTRYIVTRVPRYGVHSFEGTEVQGTGYIVSHYPWWLNKGIGLSTDRLYYHSSNYPDSQR